MNKKQIKTCLYRHKHTKRNEMKDYMYKLRENMGEKEQTIITDYN